MSFTAKSMKLTVARISGPAEAGSAHGIIEKMAPLAIGDVSGVKDEPKYGFAGWRHMQAPVNETECIVGGHLRFQMVKASRSVPASILKDECKRAELAFCQANNMDRCPSKERKRIKADTRERLLMSFVPVLKGTEVAIDMASRNVFIESTSVKEIDSLVALFHKATDSEIVPAPLDMLKAIRNNSVYGLIINGIASESSNATFSDFLTWLWFLSEENGGNVENSGYESMVEGPLTMRSGVSEPTGAMLAKLSSGGLPQVSSEAKAALLIGKKLVKCRLVIAKDKQVWDGKFDSDTMSFSGLHLPEGEAMTNEDRFVEVIESLNTIANVIQMYFDKFIEDAGDDELDKAIDKWAKERKAL